MYLLVQQSRVTDFYPLSGPSPGSRGWDQQQGQFGGGPAMPGQPYGQMPGGQMPGGQMPGSAGGYGRGQTTPAGYPQGFNNGFGGYQG